MRSAEDTKISSLTNSRGSEPTCTNWLRSAENSCTTECISNIGSVTLKFELFRSLDTPVLEVPEHYEFLKADDTKRWIEELSEAVRQAACKSAAEVEERERARAQSLLCLQHQVAQGKLEYQEQLLKKGRSREPEDLKSLAELKQEVEQKEKQLKSFYPEEGLPIPELDIEKKEPGLKAKAE